MPKVFIHYFSGTGNTKRAVDVITNRLEKNGFEIKQFIMGKNKPDITENAEFNIFAFSTLSWSAPALVLKYLHRLPQGRGEKAAVLAVYAGDPGQALIKLERLLKRKGFDVFLSGGACYPNNWSQMTNPPEKAEAKEILANGDNMALDFAEGFCKGEMKLDRESSGSFITRLSAFFFGFIGRRFLGKTYIADFGCNRCGLCVDCCPVHSIKMRGIIRKKPHWGFNCENCARCINICPRKAIQVSLPRLILHSVMMIGLISACFPLAGWGAHFFSGIYGVFCWIGAFIILLFFVLWLQFGVVDRLFFVLEQIPAFQKLFEWNFTKNNNRYIAPGFKPEVSGRNK
ncbi:MAG TPA: EFR1 family ferrodoxin [Bacillota bacterium]|nr:EFR1 family ferrodoxin [Bacillota bacterium]